MMNRKIMERLLKAFVNTGDMKMSYRELAVVAAKEIEVFLPSHWRGGESMTEHERWRAIAVIAQEMTDPENRPAQFTGHSAKNKVALLASGLLGVDHDSPWFEGECTCSPQVGFHHPECPAETR